MNLKQLQEVLFFYAKMYVVSYCMIVAFHPELNIPCICIYRSYDQPADKLTSLTHFETLRYSFFSDKDFYNKVTLKQLEDAAFKVQSREKNTALAEMFSAELKFTVDFLKNWFDKMHKMKNLELKLEQKTEYMNKNLKKSESLYFSLDSRALDGWNNHVFMYFLANIYSEKQMKLMGIENFELYSKKLNKILDERDDFCESIECESSIAMKKGRKNPEIENIIDNIT